MDWTAYYPAFVRQHEESQATEAETLPVSKGLTKQVEVADIGCGFGGLLFALAPEMPDTLILGANISQD